MTAHDCISSPDTLQAFAAEWFGCEVPPRWASLLAALAAGHKERWTTAAGPVTWLKSRLLEIGVLGECGFLTPDDSHPTCVLHVGFLSLAETKEMLERLRSEEPTEDFAPSRSQFAKHVRLHFVNPIDATAAFVTPGDGNKSR